MIWLQKKYIDFVSSQLRNFKWTGNQTANFSCPYCGDSAFDKTRSRGHLYKKKNKSFQETYSYKCHNCEKTDSFNGFLNHVAPSQAEEYRLEVFKEKQAPTQPVQKPLAASPLVFTKPTYQQSGYASLKPLSALPSTHEAVAYSVGRKLPLEPLFWAENFFEAVNEVHPSNKTIIRKEPRLCLLMKRPDKTVFGIIGRSLAIDSEARYITVKFDHDFPKMYGLDRLDSTKPCIVLEGPLDSILLPNAIAMAGGFIVPEVLEGFIDKSKTFIALDNEPRKKETLDKMLKFVKAGFRVVVWKQVASHLKDINMMLLGGYTQKQILQIIVRDSFSGLAALNEINHWKKI